MCLPAPAELLPRPTARDPTLAATLSRGTHQTSGCPNPDLSSALPLLWFLANTREMFPVSTTFHSTICPFPVQTWAFSSCGSHSTGQEEED